MTDTMQKVLTLALVEDHPFIVAKMCPLDMDASDPAVGVTIATVANGAWHGDEKIQAAFIELAKAVVAHGVNGAPGVIRSEFREEFRQ